jgi:hydrogenase maturation protein HypF
MVADLDAAARLCDVSPAEADLLVHPARPIVLLRRIAESVVAGAVAPGAPGLGILLPYTPVHHLLLRATGGIPLVLTSGNVSDEPIVFEDDDAARCLGGVADCFLTHNRAIRSRCDDSVARIVAGTPVVHRRSRGFAPAPWIFPSASPRRCWPWEAR